LESQPARPLCKSLLHNLSLSLCWPITNLFFEGPRCQWFLDLWLKRALLHLFLTLLVFDLDCKLPLVELLLLIFFLHPLISLLVNFVKLPLVLLVALVLNLDYASAVGWGCIISWNSITRALSFHYFVEQRFIHFIFTSARHLALFTDGVNASSIIPRLLCPQFMVLYLFSSNARVHISVLQWWLFLIFLFSNSQFLLPWLVFFIRLCSKTISIIIVNGVPIFKYLILFWLFSNCLAHPWFQRILIGLISWTSYISVSLINIS